MLREVLLACLRATRISSPGGTKTTGLLENENLARQTRSLLVAVVKSKKNGFKKKAEISNNDIIQLCPGLTILTRSAARVKITATMPMSKVVVR